MDGTAKITSDGAEFTINDGLSCAEGLFKIKKGQLELSLKNSSFDIDDGEYVLLFLGTPSADSEDDEFNITVTAIKPNPDYLLVKETTKKDGEIRLVQYTYNSEGQRETEKVYEGVTASSLDLITEGTYSNYDQFDNPCRCVRKNKLGEQYITEYKYTINGMLESTTEYSANGSVSSVETIEYDNYGNKIKLSKPSEDIYIEYKHKAVDVYHAFYNDGTRKKYIRKYDANNNLIKETEYLENEVVATTVYEYTYYTPAEEPQTTSYLYLVKKGSSASAAQIGSFESLDEAVSLAEKYRDQGYKVYDEYGNLIYSPIIKTEPQKLYRVRKSANDAQSQIGAFREFENARNTADKYANSGYKVYDENGNLAYAPAIESYPSSVPATSSSIYRVRKSANDAQSQIGAFKEYNNAVNLAKQRAAEGYKVYDEYGNLMYSPY